jgi:hypothetical protein
MLAINAAVGAASALAAHSGQRQMAKAQERSTMAAYHNGVAQLENQRREQGVQTQTQMSERARQAMLERGRLRAASAEGGAGGNSIDRIMGSNEFALGQDLAMMSENSRNTARQSAQEGMGMQAQAQSRLNQIERPSILNTGLQIAGIGMSAASDYKKIKKP